MRSSQTKLHYQSKYTVKIRQNNQKELKNQSDLCKRIEYDIFEHTKNQGNYKKVQINISDNQVISTYFIKGNNKNGITFYISHGFGGSSLMFFPTFNDYLQYGDIVLWEVRGMGIGIKSEYRQIPKQRINKFYVDGLQAVVQYYDHKSIYFLCHSLSAYIVLRYMLQNPDDDRISRAILLSPIGITAKNKDANNTIKNFGGCLNAAINSFGWKFNLTFKSPMRTICKCLKKNILNKAFSQFNFNKQDNQLMVSLFLTLVLLPDGSQNIFFRYILPRVLPHQGESIEELLRPGQIKKNISIYYGGNQDWVDKKGAEKLCHQNPNIKMQILRNCGHMICLSIQEMRYILSCEFK